MHPGDWIAGSFGWTETIEVRRDCPGGRVHPGSILLRLRALRVFVAFVVVTGVRMIE